MGGDAHGDERRGGARVGDGAVAETQTTTLPPVTAAEVVAVNGPTPPVKTGV